MHVDRRSEELHASNVLCLRAFVSWYEGVTPHVGLDPADSRRRAEVLIYLMSCSAAAAKVQLEGAKNRAVLLQHVACVLRVLRGHVLQARERARVLSQLMLLGVKLLHEPRGKWDDTSWQKSKLIAASTQLLAQAVVGALRNH